MIYEVHLTGHKVITLKGESAEEAIEVAKDDVYGEWEIDNNKIEIYESLED